MTSTLDPTRVAATGPGDDNANDANASDASDAGTSGVGDTDVLARAGDFSEAICTASRRR